MTFRLEIKLGNAAMQDRHDVAEALTNIAENVMFSDDDAGGIRDANGSTVGRWEFVRA